MTEIKKTASHFAAGIVLKVLDGGHYEVIGVTSKRFPREVKCPGGTNKNALWETKEQTLAREMGEEVNITMINPLLVHTEEKYGHTKYFFVTNKFEGRLEGVREFNDSDGDPLTVKWWKLDDFVRHLFHNHRTGVMMVCSVLRRNDRRFEMNYPEICRQLDAMPKLKVV